METAAIQGMSIDDVLALPEDGLRHELLDGEHVVTPSPVPRHERAFTVLFVALARIVETHGGVELFGSKSDLRLGPRTLVQPDLFLIPSIPGEALARWIDCPVPLLVVEILSPSTARRDRGIKRRLYMDAGVEEYWIVDCENEVLERWRAEKSEPELLHDEANLALSNGLNGTVELGPLWRRGA